MILDLSKTRIFLYPGHADMRKGVNGLTSMIQEEMAHNPFSGSIYLFCSRHRKWLKAVYWDKTGFWLSQKRLEKDKFPWPQNEEEAIELSSEQLQMLLTGIDFFKVHREVFYTKVS